MQPSLFGVEATEPTPADLAGLLAGPGELRQMGGTARVRVRVDAGWRVHVLVAELAERGLSASWQPVEPAADGWFEVRTAYTARLVALARQWRPGPPPGLHLNGPALRLWVAAGGAPEPDGGYLLRLRPQTRPGWPALAAALHAAGLAGDVTEPADHPAVTSPGCPMFRVTGGRHRAVLAELVGPPPAAAPPAVWPTA